MIEEGRTQGAAGRDNHGAPRRFKNRRGKLYYWKKWGANVGFLLGCLGFIATL